ncbi:MAG: Alanine--tRNA ligase [Candidatus Woesearchaeota archaeon]|nr:Alanine--tRNA ligase [Candidatus Woesearchaeota archaeon]
MKSDKQIKKELKIKASKDPDKYYATKILKKYGFKRNQCPKCNTYFWSTHKSRKVCGDSICSGGFTFFKKNPAKKLTYIQVWKEFAKLFKKLGYTPIKRYPVVARWNPTMQFTIASIAAFQPFVVSGQVKPPANSLVIPQFCMRFTDIDNVGYTGSHMTGFVMIGQHMFVPKQHWDQDKVFEHIKSWLNKGLGIKDSEITFHEDAWAGGGNSGPCMEYFVKGVELGNQVYMLYEQTPDGKLADLKLKICDMGMGMERNAWFSQATPTIYDAVFPTVIEKLLEKTQVKYDRELMKKFAKYAGRLNHDEVDDIDKSWKEIADKLNTNVEELKQKIEPMAGIFSIAEHTRALLFALNDGALPSNVGGGYNLRVLLRRSLGFADKFGWEINLGEICKWHAQYLEPIFPELMENLDNISKILKVEKQKYNNTKKKTKRIVKKIIKKPLTKEILLELYDSQGIDPEMVKKEAAKLGKKVAIPPNFFGMISDMHENKTQIHRTKREQKLRLEGIPETKANYFKDYKKTEFDATVLFVKENKVVLDKTLFYPTSGGQLHDKGKILDFPVVDVFKQGAYIIHVLEKKPWFKPGAKVHGHVDLDRRILLSQHHTSTHIVNAAAKQVLGNHINQAGAKKTMKKAHLDMTHYQSITNQQLKQIENQANKIVKQDLKITKRFYPRRKAEDKFGMQIYQGGAVPGKTVRIVKIGDIDIEACGGTHLNKTSQTGNIKILRSTKVQDGIVRIEFVAGAAAQKQQEKNQQILDKLSKMLNVPNNQIPARCQELFKKWKKARKAVKKNRDIDLKQLELSSTQKYSGNILKQTAKILRTQPKHVTKTVNRFLNQLDKFKKQIEKRNKELLEK